MVLSCWYRYLTEVGVPLPTPTGHGTRSAGHGVPLYLLSYYSYSAEVGASLTC